MLLVASALVLRDVPRGKARSWNFEPSFCPRHRPFSYQSLSQVYEPILHRDRAGRKRRRARSKQEEYRIWGCIGSRYKSRRHALYCATRFAAIEKRLFAFSELARSGTRRLKKEKGPFPMRVGSVFVTNGGFKSDQYGWVHFKPAVT